MRRTVTAYAVYLAALLFGCAACGGGPGSANDSTGLASQAMRWEPRAMQRAPLPSARPVAAPRGALAAGAGPLCPAPLPKTLPGSPTAVDKLTAAKVDSLIRFACASVVVPPPVVPPVVVVPPVITPTSGGRTVRVPAGADLAAAVLAAKPGDVLLLDSAATYTANVVLPVVPRAAGDTGWVTIRTSGTLPAPGVRVTDSVARTFPRILTPNGDPAIRTQGATERWLLQGVSVGAAPSVTQVGALVALGSIGSEQSTVAQTPQLVTLDRVQVAGAGALDVRRCVALNSGRTAILDSRLAECKSKLGDSQAVWGANGGCGVVLDNNYLSGSGENVMLGGADARSAALVPCDWTITRNWIEKPAEWQGAWSVKNLLELKVGRRVRIEGNVLEGNWIDAQVGFGVVVKAVNQDGTAPFGTTRDVRFAKNVLTRSIAGLSLHGNPEANVHPVDSVAARITIVGNWIDVPDRWLQVGTRVEALTLDHNTTPAASPAVVFTCCVQPGFRFTNNRVRTNQYGWTVSANEPDGTGDDAFAAHAPDGVFTGNVVEGATASGIPKANGTPAADAGADTTALRLMADSVRRGVRRLP